MVARSRTPLNIVIKSALKVLSHPGFARSAVSLQAEKDLFNLVHRNQDNGIAGRIRQVGFRITDLCNLRCHTCGQWGDQGYLLGEDFKSLRKRHVSPERYTELLHDLKAKGHTPILYFWGGEPMLYPKLVELMEEGAKLGMPPTIATNATRVAENAERMVEAPMFLVQISVDGADSKTHNAARPGMSPGLDNYKDCVRAFESLAEMKRKRNKKLPLVVSLTTISRENHGSLADIYHRFKDVTDAQIYYLSWWIDQKSAEEHTQDFERRFGVKAQLPFGWVGDWSKFDTNVLARELQELDRLSHTKGATPILIMPYITKAEDLHRYYNDHSATFGFKQCISIFQTPEIDSNGNLSPCRDYHDYIVGNVKDQTITELWNSTKYVDFRKSLRKDGLMPVCTRCCGLMGY